MEKSPACWLFSCVFFSFVLPLWCWFVGFLFCDAIAVQDRWFYVLPQYRGSSAAVKLIIALRQWAESKKVNELCINMSVAVEMERFNKLMTHMGFKCCGSNFSIVLT